MRRAGLHITPAMVEQAYELLRLTPPFAGWRLPDADKVAFLAVPMRGQDQAEWHFDGTRHVLKVALNKHHALPSLLATVAHEMCHMREYELGARGDVKHGKAFRRLADTVCRRHVFDRGQF